MRKQQEASQKEKASKYKGKLRTRSPVPTKVVEYLQELEPGIKHDGASRRAFFRDSRFT